ncbi:hypothetical protein [Streptomyces sp. NEAU-174]|uniref:hypothetical protein n=1 Tax=Streptomyces sp. NEAU-174 TaxID=3458254 RepID=UPI004044A0F2
MNPRPEATLDSALMMVLTGLVAVRILALARPGEMARAHAEAAADGGLVDIISETGDRLTAPGNFRGPCERKTRAEVLNAMAACLALGAHQPGGVTWAGHHWCTAPHDNCPNRRYRAA